MTIYAELSHKV